MAKNLARNIGYTYIDTGAMYRAVTLYALRNGFLVDGAVSASRLEEAMVDIKISFVIKPETGDSETYLNGENVEREIRGMEVAQHVSKVAALPFVRKAMVEQQHRTGVDKGIVMDGRDIGTVVFPDAELKIFVTALPEVRARRRLEESIAKGDNVSYDEILDNVKSRDYQDMTRSVSPLRKADDAIELDNTYMTISEQDAWLIGQYHNALTFKG